MDRVAGDKVQSLFHRASVYPSKSQVVEMIHCARERETERDCERNYLTFGEYCLFANELKKCYDRESVYIFPQALFIISILKDLLLNFPTGYQDLYNCRKCRRRAAMKRKCVTARSQVRFNLSAINHSIRNQNCCFVTESAAKYEVFLGGSCNPTTWRQDIAIPTLKSLGITYFNPVR